MFPFKPPSWVGPPIKGAKLKSLDSDEFSLEDKSFYLFGRNKEMCDFVIEHSSVSRTHCAIVHHENKRLYLIDLCSTHGTVINGKRAENNKPLELQDGAKIDFGSAPNVYYVTLKDSRKRKATTPENETLRVKMVKEGPDSVQCSHILVKHAGSRRPSSHKEETITRTQQEAEHLVSKFRNEIQNSKDKASKFAEIAERESHCSSFKRGGDLGDFGRGKMQAIFEKASFALKVGEISDLVLSDSGIHIILRTK
mmetsp:Transcript_23139/g.32041  ORF Transcript_23139/g.32041 Transcript_23139/m.32041 type:complete len:253 (-) Transcript_23139:71-829(-)